MEKHAIIYLAPLISAALRDWEFVTDENKVLPLPRQNKYLDLTALFKIKAEKQTTVRVFRRLGASLIHNLFQSTWS